MTSFHDYLAAGNAWLFVPAAILLGALHGLEPGHSKTMMAAFIVSIRGTVKQALLLGLSATASHTGVIWILAGIGFRSSARLDVETLEPYFQVGIGFAILAMAGWMSWRIHTAKHHREHAPAAAHHCHHDPTLELIAPEESADPHERAHAVEIPERFANRPVTTWQIVLVGLSGGLIPCPAAFAVLLACLQLKRFALGFALVIAFSLGLAITLMTVGAIAALSINRVTRHLQRFGHLVRNAPYFSAGIMLLVGTFILINGARNWLR